MSLDTENAPFLDCITTVVVSTGKCTHPVAYSSFGRTKQPDDADFPCSEEAHLNLCYIVLVAQYQTLKRQMPHQRPVNSRPQRGPPAFLETAHGTQTGKWLTAVQKPLTSSRPTRDEGRRMIAQGTSSTKKAVGGPGGTHQDKIIFLYNHSLNIPKHDHAGGG